MVIYLGKTRYHVDTKNFDVREAISIISEYCKERNLHYTSPLVVNNKLQTVNITDKNGKHVTTCRIYDKR